MPTARGNLTEIVVTPISTTGPSNVGPFGSILMHSKAIAAWFGLGSPNLGQGSVAPTAGQIWPRDQ